MVAINWKKEIEKSISSIAGAHSAYEVFNDWITCCALSIANSTRLIHDEIWKEREKRYEDPISRYPESQHRFFSDMMGMLTLALEDHYTDFLGEIFMDMKMGSSATGQFFIPFHVSELNAEMSLNVDELKNSEEIIYMNEPACGGGCAIIAVAKVLRENNIDFQKRLRVVAQDLDWRSVYMTYLQISLIGINGIVVQGDTLGEPYTKGYPERRILRTPSAQGALL